MTRDKRPRTPVTDNGRGIYLTRTRRRLLSPFRPRTGSPLTRFYMTLLRVYSARALPFFPADGNCSCNAKNPLAASPFRFELVPVPADKPRGSVRQRNARLLPPLRNLCGAQLSIAITNVSSNAVEKIVINRGWREPLFGECLNGLDTLLRLGSNLLRGKSPECIIVA